MSNELKETNNILLGETILKNSLVIEKRQMSETVVGLQKKLEESIETQKSHEERSKLTNNALADLNSRLKQQRDALTTSEMLKKNMENQLVSLQCALSEMESNCFKNSRRELEILEHRVKIKKK